MKSLHTDRFSFSFWESWNRPLKHTVAEMKNTDPDHLEMNSIIYRASRHGHHSTGSSSCPLVTWLEVQAT